MCLKNVSVSLCRNDVWNHFLQYLLFLIQFLTYLPSYYMEKHATIMLQLGFFLKYKIGLQIGNTEFIQK